MLLKYRWLYLICQILHLIAFFLNFLSLPSFFVIWAFEPTFQFLFQSQEVHVLPDKIVRSSSIFIALMSLDYWMAITIKSDSKIRDRIIFSTRFHLIHRNKEFWEVIFIDHLIFLSSKHRLHQNTPTFPVALIKNQKIEWKTTIHIHDIHAKTF